MRYPWYCIPFEKETLSSIGILKKEHDEALGLGWNWESPHWVPDWTVGRFASLASHDTW